MVDFGVNMERDEIIRAVSGLPELPVFKYPIADREIFEGDDHEGHFTLTRNFARLPNGQKISFYSLSVSGILPASRTRIIQDFTLALGEPALPPEYDEKLGTHRVSWLIPNSQPQP